MAIITVEPNPVFVPKGVNVGETAVEWKTQATALGRVWQSIDEGQGYGPDTLVAPRRTNLRRATARRRSRLPSASPIS